MLPSRSCAARFSRFLSCLVLSCLHSRGREGRRVGCYRRYCLKGFIEVHASFVRRPTVEREARTHARVVKPRRRGKRILRNGSLERCLDRCRSVALPSPRRGRVIQSRELWNFCAGRFASLCPCRVCLAVDYLVASVPIRRDRPQSGNLWLISGRRMCRYNSTPARRMCWVFPRAHEDLCLF